MTTNKDTIDKLNRLEFFYWNKPTKTPEVLEQDKEIVERDFALIRKDLEVLVLLKDMFEKQWLKVIRDDYGFCVITSDKFDDDDFYISNITYAKLKEWLDNEEDY